MPRTTETAGSADDELVDSLAQTAFSMMAILNRIGAENDLSPTQIRVLGILRDRRAGMSELAEFLGLEKSTMTGLVARAERRGLLERTASARDGRAVDVALTTDGAELAARLARQVRTALAPVAQTLNPAEQRRLTTLLGRVVGPFETVIRGR